MRASSVPEVAYAGEHHRDAALVGCGNDLVVAHTAAGLDHGARTRIYYHVEPVTERKECIRRDDRPLQAQARILRLYRSDARGIDPAHLSCAHTQRRTVFAEDDGIRLHEFG